MAVILTATSMMHKPTSAEFQWLQVICNSIHVSWSFRLPLMNLPWHHPVTWPNHCSLTVDSHSNSNTRLMALCPGLSGWYSTRKVKPIWIYWSKITVSGSDISWAICKSVSRFRQITMPAAHHSVFTGQMPFLPPSQQHQSTEVESHTDAKCLNRPRIL